MNKKSVSWWVIKAAGLRAEGLTARIAGIVSRAAGRDLVSASPGVKAPGTFGPSSGALRLRSVTALKRCPAT